ncbi:MAG TPA: class E sortase [Jatrophihabitantaceae bacterium]|jgi:sortase A|nr:class E sortase [Jatrophihabitantaceae bacterium]
MSDGTVAVGDAPPPADPPEPPGPPPGGGGGGGRHGREPDPHRVGDLVRMFVRGLGQLLVTAGVIVLLFVVYEVYVTNWFAHREQHRVHQALEQEWSKGELALPESGLAALDGHGIANLYIPRFGEDYAWTIVQGTNDADLEKGPGHYDGTQLPGQKGDFALAGHRVGKGEPFLNLDKLRAGDSVVVETQTTWYVYCVIGAGTDHAACDPSAPGASLSNTYADPSGTKVPGREIVSPSDGNVILPVPSDPAVPAQQATVRYLTMTTCHPKFTAAKRMIVHAVLGRTIPKQAKGNGRYDDTIPAQIKALYTEVGN